MAVSDEEYRQALQDRITGTVIVETRRGFSLDLRLKELLAELRYRMRK
jgi:vacuolar-type H+-ATPase subunit E/Vma4